jgi:hypothetical protein
MGKTQSKPLAARHGRGTTWARHGMCELDFKYTAGHVTAFLDHPLTAVRKLRQK